MGHVLPDIMGAFLRGVTQLRCTTNPCDIWNTPSDRPIQANDTFGNISGYFSKDRKSNSPRVKIDCLRLVEVRLFYNARISRNEKILLVNSHATLALV